MNSQKLNEFTQDNQPILKKVYASDVVTPSFAQSHKKTLLLVLVLVIFGFFTFLVGAKFASDVYFSHSTEDSNHALMEMLSSLF